MRFSAMLNAHRVLLEKVLFALLANAIRARRMFFVLLGLDVYVFVGQFDSLAFAWSLTVIRLAPNHL